MILYLPDGVERHIAQKEPQPSYVECNKQKLDKTLMQPVIQYAERLGVRYIVVCIGVPKSEKKYI